MTSLSLVPVRTAWLPPPISMPQTASIRVLGEPMSFWERQMPTGMLLRSPYVASNIADPGHALTLDDYEADTQQSLSRPVPLEQFVRYGRWFQQQAAPRLDTRDVADSRRMGYFG